MITRFISESSRRLAIAIVATGVLVGVGLFGAFSLPSSAASNLSPACAYPPCSPPPPPPPPPPPTPPPPPGGLAPVKLLTAQNATLKAKIVVSQTRRTLYHLTTEKGKKFVCTGGCATIWPPLTVPKGAKLVAGPGITRSKLRTIKRPDGRIQVTYYGLTLYRYSGDSKAGQTNGEGIQNIWYAISPAGKLVK